LDLKSHENAEFASDGLSVYCSLDEDYPFFEQLPAQPLPELNVSFLMALWPETQAFPEKREQIFVAAGFVSHPDKARGKAPQPRCLKSHPRFCSIRFSFQE
jgi:hypothetical protein